MQNYTEIPSSTTLSDSLSQILNNDKTALSLSSGTSFPTVNLQLGMPCFRTDEQKLYILTVVSPPVHLGQKMRYRSSKPQKSRCCLLGCNCPCYPGSCR